MNRTVGVGDGTTRVLLVGTDATLAESIRADLQQRSADLDCSSADGVEAASDQLGDEPVDCVVVAVGETAETDAVESIRQRHGGVPVVVAARSGEGPGVDAALEAGASDYVPFRTDRDDVALLERRIRTLVEATRDRSAVDRQQRLLDRAQEMADLGIWEYVPSTGDLDWSDGIRQIHGVDADYEPTLSAAVEFYHPDDRDAIEAAVERAVQDGEAYDLDLRLVRADGAVRTVRAWGGPVERPGTGEVVVRGVLQDVTERTRQRRKYRELAEEYEALLETSGDAIFLVDVEATDDGPTFRFARLSRGYETQTGLTTEEVRGKTPQEVFGEEAGAELASNYRRCLEARDPISYREELSFAEEARIWETGLAPVIIDDEVVRIVGIARNITEQVERERELEATNQRLESLIEAAPLTIMEVDADGTVTRWNEGAEEMFGWPREEVVGASNPIALDGDHDDFKTHRDRALDGERIHGTEVTAVRKDGDHLDVLLSVVPLTDSDGTVTSILTLLEDISEQKQLEADLRALQATSQRLTRSESTEAIGEVAVETAAEVLGYDIAEIWTYDDVEEALVPVAETAAARETFGEPPRLTGGESLAWEAFTSDGIRVYEDVQSQPGSYNRDTEMEREIMVPLDDYGLLSAGARSPGAFSDIEVDLFRILGATVEAAFARAKRQERLERQNERLDQFVSVVAHDLRNPLSVADGFLEVAERTGDPEHFERVADAHNRMERLIEDLLTLARSDTRVEDPQRVDLGTVADGAWANVDTADATLDVRDGLSTVGGDRGRLTQLFENLFRNAVEHGGADAAVTVGPLSERPGFYVADDGPGIPPDRRETVFEHGTSSSDGGTGFGLSIVDDIVKAHGWSIAITDSEADGARFEVDTSG